MSFVLLVVYPHQEVEGLEVPVRQEVFGPWDSEHAVRIDAGQRGWIPSDHGSFYVLVPMNDCGSIAVIMPQHHVEGPIAIRDPHGIPHALPWAH